MENFHIILNCFKSVQMMLLWINRMHRLWPIHSPRSYQIESSFALVSYAPLRSLRQISCLICLFFSRCLFCSCVWEWSLCDHLIRSHLYQLEVHRYPLRPVWLEFPPLHSHQLLSGLQKPCSKWQTLLRSQPWTSRNSTMDIFARAASSWSASLISQH